MVYYRKYRPQKIADLDSTTVRETLQSVLTKEIPHAFLFTGPKGLGKTSTARIVAKVVNCDGRKKGEYEPDNTCEHCISITNGTNLDVLEIDAASNRGIDEIRELKEKIRLAPVAAKVKVYIIDEVHMLTTEAFNALLKTLEEPPAHAMFILATTEPHKIPATILSRCFHINFSLATDTEIVHSLKRIITGENITTTDDVLFALAKIAEGGFRDAAKLLEEVVLLSDGKTITKELFEQSYKSANIHQHVIKVLTAFKTNEVKIGLETINTVVMQGIDIKYFLQQLIEMIREMLLQQVGIVKGVQELGFSKEELTSLITFLTHAYFETKSAVIPQLPLELALIEWCSELSGVTPVLSAPYKEIDDGKVTVSSLRKHIGIIKKAQALSGTPKKSKEEGETIETTTVELHHTPGDGTITKEWLDAFWRSLISEMKKHNHTAAGLLRSCVISSYADNHLVITAAYKFHKERLDDPKTRTALIAACKLLTGKSVEVTIELKAGR